MGSHGITLPLKRFFLEKKLGFRLHRYEPDLIPTLPSGLAIQLPDKEFRYLRTIIVIADIHQGLYSHHPDPYGRRGNDHMVDLLALVRRHPYTSSYEFAGSCVFDKQSPEILSPPPQFALEV